MMNALSLQNLKKTYKNGVEALKGVSLDVREGDFFGLLGPNGAGKTTIIGITSGLVNKTSGKIRVFGIDTDKDFDEAKKLIGIVPQEYNFNMFEKVYDIVVSQAGYYGVPKNVAKENAEKYLKQLSLWDKKDSPSRTLSGGMKRRLMIARGLVHEPKLLILDEPTAGVDVELRRETWEFLLDLNKKGITIILTTHNLEEAELLCNNIAMINGGKIIENTSKKKLLLKLEEQSYLLELNTTIEKIPIIDGYKLVRYDNTTIEVTISKKQTLNELFNQLNKEGIIIISMRNKTNRLEKLFVETIQRSKK